VERAIYRGEMAFLAREGRRPYRILNTTAARLKSLPVSTL
jgi:hypothetical protein